MSDENCVQRDREGSLLEYALMRLPEDVRANRLQLLRNLGMDDELLNLECLQMGDLHPELSEDDAQALVGMLDEAAQRADAEEKKI